VSDTTPSLDDAFERIGAATSSLPNGFVNHWAMACEARPCSTRRRRHRPLVGAGSPCGRGIVNPVVPSGVRVACSASDYQPAPGRGSAYFPMPSTTNCWSAVVATWGAAAEARACHRRCSNGAIGPPTRAFHRRGRHNKPPRRGELALARVTGRPATAPGSRPAPWLRPAGDLRIGVVLAAGRLRTPLPDPSRHCPTCKLRHPARWAVEILAGHIPATDAPPRCPMCSPSTPRCSDPDPVTTHPPGPLHQW